MNFKLFLNIKLQISKVQMQTLQTQKTPVSTVYSNVTARIDTVNEQNNKMKNDSAIFINIYWKTSLVESLIKGDFHRSPVRIASGLVEVGGLLLNIMLF